MLLEKETALFQKDKIKNDIENLQDEVGNTSSYFWHQDGSGTEAGAHVTEVPQAQFISNPSGGNILFQSNTIRIRNAQTILANFTGSTVTLGSGSKKTIVNDSGMTIGTSAHKIRFGTNETTGELNYDGVIDGDDHLLIKSGTNVDINAGSTIDLNSQAVIVRGVLSKQLGIYIDQQVTNLESGVTTFSFPNGQYYDPIGVIGFNTEGSGSNNLVVRGAWVSGTNAYLKIVNTSSSTLRNITLTAWILCGSDIDYWRVDDR